MEIFSSVRGYSALAACTVARHMMQIIGSKLSCGKFLPT